MLDKEFRPVGYEFSLKDYDPSAPSEVSDRLQSVRLSSSHQYAQLPIRTGKQANEKKNFKLKDGQVRQASVTSLGCGVG